MVEIEVEPFEAAIAVRVGDQHALRRRAGEIVLEPRRVPRLAGAGDRHGVERREPVDQRAPGGLKRLARRRRQGRERVDPAVMRADADRLEKLPTIEQMGERERQHRLARVIGVTVDRAGGEGETVAIGGADRRLVGEAGGQAREGLGDLAMGDEVEGDWLALDDGLERNAAVIAVHRSLAEPEAVDALATRQQPRLDRRAGILAVEFSELPLASQEP
jgi:hypothetical protein